MQEEDFDREIKVLVVGNGGVGKTSMIRRFCKGVFTDEYKKTIGVDFLEKATFVDALQEEVRFMLWDTAGQEEFDAITRAYFRGAGAAVIAFSTTDRPSFEAVSMWKQKVEEECGDIAMCLVQNKVDLIDRAVARADEVEAIALKLKIKLYRTCVKENVNVSEVFTYLAELNTKKVAKEARQQAEAAAVAAANHAASIDYPNNAGQDGPSGGSDGDDGGGGGGGGGGNEAPRQDPAEIIERARAQKIDLKPGKRRTDGKKKVRTAIKGVV